MWSKYITRRLAVQVAQAWNYGWGEPMEKVYGISVKNTLVYRDDKKTEYYVNKRQHDKYVQGLYLLLEDEKFLDIFHQEARVKLEEILQNAQSYLDVDLAKKSDDELLELYKNFILPNVEQFYIRMWTVFNIGDPLANVVKNNLKRYINSTKLNDYLLRLSSPLVPNDVINERIDLLKLVIEKKRLPGDQFKQKLLRHVLNYQHIPMFDFDHNPYGEEHFIKEMDKLDDPQKELEDLEKLFANRKEDFEKILKELQPDNYLEKLLYFLKENVFLRDYRDMIRQKLNLELRKFYQEAAKRLGITLDQIATMTNEEIINNLEGKEKISKETLKQREKDFLLIQKGDSVEIYSGTEAIEQVGTELKAEKLQARKRFSGVIGSKGKVRGEVVIVYTNKDLAKVKKGDILAAAMTRQDFVSAMRLCGGLITDEGSVTCHAAIISRELNIPCIVGTKIATKVLKDGDIVEVDADKGVVRKIQ